MKKETQAIRIQSRRSESREHSTPLFLTSSFVFDSAEQGADLFADKMEGNIYTRFSNPNTSEFIDKMVVLEDTEAGFAFSSGMAAIFGSLAGILRSGDHVISSRSLFGSTFQILTAILPRWGITHTFVDSNNPDEWESAVNSNTKVIFAETPSNPGLDVVDLAMLNKLKEKYNLILNIDNSFATPALQNPASFGADLITHSATKYLDGQGRVIGGIVVGKKALIDEIRFFARQTGPCLAPFNAWILAKSLETLYVRVERHCQNALRLAEKFNGHPEIETVKYPFLTTHPQYELARKQMKMGGGIVTLTIKGGIERVKKFINALQVVSITANLGDTRTTVTHPASTTHSKLQESERLLVGITPGLVRISVGLENAEDIIDDITQALEKSR